MFVGGTYLFITMPNLQYHLKTSKLNAQQVALTSDKRLSIRIKMAAISKKTTFLSYIKS